jgi:AraC-like DNA-binding protein
MNVPYFLANQDTYRDANVGFPFRTFTYGIGITYSGTPALFKIGSTDYELQTGSLTTIGPGIVSQWAGDFSGINDTLYFTEDLFRDSIQHTFLQSLTFFQPGGRHVIQLEAEEMEMVKVMFSTIKTLQQEKAAMPGLVYSLLMLANSYHQSRYKENGGASSGQERVVSRFRTLLARHFSEEKEVSFYAAELNITPKYLSEILTAQSGKSAKAHIDEYVAMEAKSLLRQTTMSVQEIAYWLGYEDPSYFVKTFRKWEGRTPVQYRKL